DILKNAPYEGSFFPKEYDVEDKTYHFDDDVNMIDQSLIALNRASSEMLTTRFYEFIIHEMDMNGMIFGQYDLETEKPLVKYESPAVYGWLILYSLEINDYDLVKDLYKRMRQRQVKNFSKNFKFKLATCAFVNFAVIENTFLYAVVSNFISLLN